MSLFFFHLLFPIKGVNITHVSANFSDGFTGVIPVKKIAVENREETSRSTVLRENDEVSVLWDDKI